MGAPNRCKRCRRAIDLLGRQILCLDCQEVLYEAEQRLLDRVELARRPSPAPVTRIEAPPQPEQIVPRPRGPQAKVDHAAGPHREKSSAKLPPGMVLAGEMVWFG